MRKILGGKIRFENLGGMCEDLVMAKYPDYNSDACPKCCSYYTVTFESLEARTVWVDGRAVYTPASRDFVKSCACADSWVDSINSAWLKQKEPKVTKEFDTTANKSAALNAILNRVEDIERALYARVEARIKLETEHNATITEASAKLNRALAESIHAGIEEEDLELHLPDHCIELSERLLQVSTEMSLDNVLEGV